MNAPQFARLRLGAICTVSVAAVSGLIWGRAGVAGAATFGVVATGLQLLAARQMARTGKPAAPDHLKVYAIGVILRLCGVILLGVGMSIDPALFPPLPSALGYAGTVLPLLYLETRLAS